MSLQPTQELVKKMSEMSDDKRRIPQNVFHYGNYELDDIEDPERKVSLLISEYLIDDPIYIRKLVDCIYADAQQKRLDESQVIADFTGGTKAMTVGMVLACTHPSRRLQYISQLDPCPLKEVKISYKLKSIKST